MFSIKVFKKTFVVSFFFGALLILILPELPFLSTKIRVSSFFINSRNMALILRIWENFSSSGWAGGELALC